MHSKNLSAYFCTFLLTLAACGKVVPIEGAESDAAPNEVADAMVVLGACEGDDIAIDDLFDCFIAAQCEWAVRCQSIAPTVEACIELFDSLGDSDLKRKIESVNVQRTIYDGELAADCLASVFVESCSGQPGEDCEGVFVGTIAEGGLCYDEDECQGVGADCEQDSCENQCCAGTCLDAAPLGGDCTNRGCEPGAECVFNQEAAIQNQCYSGEVGVICQYDYHCDSGLFCADTQTCQPALTAGADCNSNSQCLDPLTCVGESNDAGKCQLVNSVGVSCDTSCDGNLFCDVPGQATIGSCTPPKPLNSMCASDSQCLPNLYCSEVDRMCQARRLLNTSCQSYSCVAGLFCTSELPSADPDTLGVCADPVVNGQECNSDSHCASAICNADICEQYESCY